MKRRNFLRDIALGIAATLVPRILMPVIPEVAEDGECIFNAKMINDRMAELRQYPLTIEECYYYVPLGKIDGEPIHNIFYYKNQS